MISPEQEALILRLHHAEKWRVGTIAQQLGLHRDVVIRVLEEAAALKPEARRPSLIDPYVPFITETFKKYPEVTAARLYDMIKERGYVGHPDLHPSPQPKQPRPCQPPLHLPQRPLIHGDDNDLANPSPQILAHVQNNV